MKIQKEEEPFRKALTIGDEELDHIKKKN